MLQLKEGERLTSTFNDTTWDLRLDFPYQPNYEATWCTGEAFASMHVLMLLHYSNHDPVKLVIKHVMDDLRGFEAMARETVPLVGPHLGVSCVGDNAC